MNGAIMMVADAIKKVLEDAYEKAKKTLTENRDKLVDDRLE